MPRLLKFRRNRPNANHRPRPDPETPPPRPSRPRPSSQPSSPTHAQPTSPSSTPGAYPTPTPPPVVMEGMNLESASHPPPSPLPQVPWHSTAKARHTLPPNSSSNGNSTGRSLIDAASKLRRFLRERVSVTRSTRSSDTTLEDIPDATARPALQRFSLEADATIAKCARDMNAQASSPQSQPIAHENLPSEHSPPPRMPSATRAGSPKENPVELGRDPPVPSDGGSKDNDVGRRANDNDSDDNHVLSKPPNVSAPRMPTEIPAGYACDDGYVSFIVPPGWFATKAPNGFCLYNDRALGYARAVLASHAADALLETARLQVTSHVYALSSPVLLDNTACVHYSSNKGAGKGVAVFRRDFSGAAAVFGLCGPNDKQDMIEESVEHIKRTIRVVAAPDIDLDAEQFRLPLQRASQSQMASSSGLWDLQRVSSASIVVAETVSAGATEALVALSAMFGRARNMQWPSWR